MDGLLLLFALSKAGTVPAPETAESCGPDASARVGSATKHVEIRPSPRRRTMPSAERAAYCGRNGTAPAGLQRAYWLTRMNGAQIALGILQIADHRCRMPPCPAAIWTTDERYYC
jgi:hypothetical protein